MGMIKGLIGCLVGGAIGATIWAVVASMLDMEIGFVAWGVGVLCGLGMYVGAKGNSGIATGVIACVISLLSIAAGKIAVIHTLVQRHVAQSASESVYMRPVDADSAPIFMADQLVEEYESQGKALTWPEGMDADTAEKPEDFPKELWEDATARWASMTDDQKTQYIAQMEAVRSERMSIGMAAFDGVILVESLSLYDALWAFLALGSAFKIGSGNGDSGGDD